jgi:hypothetical protein
MHLKLRRKKRFRRLRDVGDAPDTSVTYSFITIYVNETQVRAESKSWLLTCTSTPWTSTEKARLCTKKS